MAKARRVSSVYELTLSTKDDHPGTAEILKDILLNVGIKNQDISEYQKNSHNYLCTFLKTKRKADTVKKRFTALKLKKIKITLKVLKPKDWQNKWKEDFKPVKIARSFIVIPVWDRKKFDFKAREPIYMDESFAFGTGQHETTRFMAELIEKHRDQFETFLDIGTGTGILSLVASKCGARDITAIDMDENCIKATKANLKINGYKNGRIKFTNLKNFKDKGRYDFVAANLITHTLIDLKRKILSFVKRDKFLAVSGISNENLARLRREYKQLPLRCLKILKGKDWSAVLYKRIA